MPPIVKKWLIALALVIVFACFYFSLSIDGWASTRKDFIGLLDVLFNLLIGCSLFYIGWEANNIARASRESTSQSKIQHQSHLREYERNIFKENYQLVNRGVELVWKMGCVEEEALSFFWQARDAARTELPNDIAEYTEKLRTTAQKAYAAYRFTYDANGQAINMDREERRAKVDEAHEAVGELLEEKPYEIYRRHLRISSSKGGGS